MFENILVAVDGSKTSDASFEAALEVAQKFNSDLIVLSVYPGSTGMGVLVSGVDEDAFKSIAEEALAAYEKRLKVEHNFSRARMFLKKGDAAKVIIETAKAENCGLIVLGSRGRGEFTELLLGSVSHKVLLHATSPVLIVREDQR
jgi:nucleotide-binding universal stress UspA family protein